jgi:hypothetical protein
VLSSRKVITCNVAVSISIRDVYKRD